MSALATSPSVPTSIDVNDIKHLTARLAQVLAEEADLLDAMKVKQVQGLQKEKTYLINALESHKKALRKYPQLVAAIPSAEKEEMRRLQEVVNNVVQINVRKTKMAMEVNQRIVRAIADTVREKSLSPSYNGVGIQENMRRNQISITLNQTI